MNLGRVLVVDDEGDIRALLCELLTRAGYEAVEASDGQRGLRSFYEHRPDLVIADVGMPGLDGWQLLERIRELSDVPVLLLTARSSELEKVRGLKAGADDYVTKPFGRQELLARIEALLRRPSGQTAAAPDAYTDGLLTVDFVQHTVVSAGEDVQLTPLEFRLLSVFVRHPSQLLSHDQLIDLTWGGAARASGAQLKLYVGYLRRKLGPAARDRIETVRGFGYRFRPPAGSGG